MASYTMHRQLISRLLLLLALVSLLPSKDALIVRLSGSFRCSSTCESEYCSEPPFLRYGKYCGIGYTGCQGEVPCDNLDVCCQSHDSCIGNDLSNYLNKTCNQNLLHCVTAYRNSGDPQFPGNTCDIGSVEDTIDWVMEVAIHL